MKKIIVWTLVAMMIALTGCSPKEQPAPMEPLTELGTSAPESEGNYTDDMKIEKVVDLSSEDGSDSTERDGDHKDSLYFSSVDFYNATSSDTLTILPQFKTIQQTSEWSCGVDAAMMVANYYGMLGDHTEETVAMFRSNKLAEEATTLAHAIQMFEGIGEFELETTLDYGDKIYEEFTLETIENYLKEGIPVMVAWNDYGGHWQVIIGYDTMGTETTGDDVIIVADSYDSTDHNQDGYGVYGAERFYYNFTMYDFFPEEEGNDMLFVAAKPTA